MHVVLFELKEKNVDHKNIRRRQFIARMVIYAFLVAFGLLMVVGMISDLKPNPVKSKELSSSIWITRSEDYDGDNTSDKYYLVDGQYSVTESGFWFMRNKSYLLETVIWPNNGKMSVDCDEQEPPDEYGYKLCRYQDEFFYIQPDKGWPKWEP